MERDFIGLPNQNGNTVLHNLPTLIRVVDRHAMEVLSVLGQSDRALHLHEETGVYRNDNETPILPARWLAANVGKWEVVP
jgi:hypothetical protein